MTSPVSNFVRFRLRYRSPVCPRVMRHSPCSTAPPTRRKGGAEFAAASTVESRSGPDHDQGTPERPPLHIPSRLQARRRPGAVNVGWPERKRWWRNLYETVRVEMRIRARAARSSAGSRRRAHGRNGRGPARPGPLQLTPTAGRSRIPSRVVGPAGTCCAPSVGRVRKPAAVGAKWRALGVALGGSRASELGGPE